MNSRKAKQEARLLRKERAIKEARSAEGDVMEMEGRQLLQQVSAADAKGKPVELPKMSVRTRKLVRRSEKSY